jgi:hypothetical protein
MKRNESKNAIILVSQTLTIGGLIVIVCTGGCVLSVPGAVQQRMGLCTVMCMYQREASVVWKPQ